MKVANRITNPRTIGPNEKKALDILKPYSVEGKDGVSLDFNND